MGIYDERHLGWLRRLGSPGRWLADHLSDAKRLLGEGLHVQETISRGNRLILGVVFTVRSVMSAEITVRASSITYTFIFSLVPLLATTVFLLAAVPGLQDERQSLEGALFEYFLPGAARAVQEYIAQFTAQAGAAGAVSSLVFFVITLLLLQSMEQSFNVIWKVRHPRTWRQRLEVLSITFIGGALALTALTAVGGLARRASKQVELLGGGGFGSAMTQLGLTALEVLLAWVVFTIATKGLPNTPVRWRSSVVAGVLTGTSWHFLKGAFTWYISTFPSYENLYGALGTVPIFLLWCYLSFVLLFACGSIAYVHQNLTRLIEQERMRSGTNYPMAYFAVSILAVLVERFRDRKTVAKMSVQELSDVLGVEPLLVSRVLEPMVERRVVVEVEEEAGPTYLLGVAAESLTVRDVVLAATGDPLAVPDQDSGLHSELRSQIVDIFGAARVARDSALDVVDMASLGLEVRPSPRGVERAVEKREKARPG